MWFVLQKVRRDVRGLGEFIGYIGRTAIVQERPAALL
jgi:hypothetical protein